MNIVKRSKDLSLRQSQKRQFRYWCKPIRGLIPAVLLASHLATILDLYFVGCGLYSFPNRPFPAIFSINIAFTLIGIPSLMIVFLYICGKVNNWQRVLLIFTLSLLMSVTEKLSEVFGLFSHQESWQHLYTFGGYLFFLTFIYSFYKWSKS